MMVGLGCPLLMCRLRQRFLSCCAYHIALKFFSSCELCSLCGSAPGTAPAKLLTSTQGLHEEGKPGWKPGLADAN